MKFLFVLFSIFLFSVSSFAIQFPEINSALGKTTYTPPKKETYVLPEKLLCEDLPNQMSIILEDIDDALLRDDDSSALQSMRQYKRGVLFLGKRCVPSSLKVDTVIEDIEKRTPRELLDQMRFFSKASSTEKFKLLRGL